MKLEDPYDVLAPPPFALKRKVVKLVDVFANFELWLIIKPIFEETAF